MNKSSIVTEKRKYYTTKGLSELLGVSESTIRRWGREKKIGTLQPYGRKGKILFFIDELDK